MAERDVGSADGLGLADAIALLREELLEARAEGATAEIQLPIESMTVELTVSATKSVDGKAGFKVPFVNLEVGGGAAREHGSTQIVTVVFGGPVDREGRPVKVARASGESSLRSRRSVTGGWSVLGTTGGCWCGTLPPLAPRRSKSRTTSGEYRRSVTGGSSALEAMGGGCVCGIRRPRRVRRRSS
jgi:hypothetical protein